MSSKLLEGVRPRGRLHVCDGFFDRYPRIRLIVPHLRDSLPYLAARLDNGFRAHPACREYIADPPSTYLKRLYYDSVSFHVLALECGIAAVSADRLVLGSGSPHVIGGMASAMRSAIDLGVDRATKKAIFDGNTQRMLGW
ncbi:MAG: amidohydrolase family protein [Clostridia bacterium]